MKEFDHPDKFVNRHIGPTEEELDQIEAKGSKGRPLKDILKDLEKQS